MLGLVKQYTHWLHGRWPDGEVEKQAIINANGTTRRFMARIRSLGRLRS